MNSPLQFTLTIPSAPTDFQVLAFSGREAIGAPFRFDLELVSDDADIDHSRSGGADPIECPVLEDSQ